MKKIFQTLLSAVAVIGLSTSCADIPAPYDIFGGGTYTGKTLPYKSSNLNSGWETHAISEYDPWSMGSTYAQATGYQKWDGADSKTNKDVEGYLISPAICTNSTSGQVAVTFDHCIAYSSNDASYADHTGLYVSKDYDGKNFDEATWEKLPFTISSDACNSTWTLVSAGKIILPEAYVNAENVRFAFYMKSASASKSITWELMNFVINEADQISGEGDGDDTPDTPSEGTEITCAQAVELCAALADGASSTEVYTITGYITDVFATISKGQQSFWMADTKDGGKIVQAYWANLPEGVESFKAGTKVKITGNLLKYVKSGTVTTEVKNATVEILEEGSGSDTPATGTEVTCAKAAELTLAMDDKTTSTETYSVTGYITDVYATVSNNQQSFWMADTKDGGKVFEAYWANLPEGVSAFTVGSKVRITGKLTRYGSTPEIKNATVEILEEGSGETGGETDSGETAGSSEGITVSGTEVTLENSGMDTSAGRNSIINMSDFGYTNGQDVTEITGDFYTITFAKGEAEKNTPKYYDNGTNIRIYPGNTITIKGTNGYRVPKVVIYCDSYNGVDCVGQSTATLSCSDNVMVYTNKGSATGTASQMRIKSIRIYYETN